MLCVELREYPESKYAPPSRYTDIQSVYYLSLKLVALEIYFIRPFLSKTYHL